MLKSKEPDHFAWDVITLVLVVLAIYILRLVLEHASR